MSGTPRRRQASARPIPTKSSFHRSGYDRAYPAHTAAPTRTRPRSPLAMDLRIVIFRDPTAPKQPVAQPILLLPPPELPHRPRLLLPDLRAVPRGLLLDPEMIRDPHPGRAAAVGARHRLVGRHAALHAARHLGDQLALLALALLLALAVGLGALAAVGPGLAGGVGVLPGGAEHLADRRPGQPRGLRPHHRLA